MFNNKVIFVTGGTGSFGRTAARILLEKNNPKKVIIFSEYKDTARYISNDLQDSGFEHVEELDSSSTKDRRKVIKRFAPYYNKSSSAEIRNEIQILMDVISSVRNIRATLNVSPAKEASLIIRGDKNKCKDMIRRGDNPCVNKHTYSFYICNCTRHQIACVVFVMKAKTQPLYVIIEMVTYIIGYSVSERFS